MKYALVTGGSRGIGRAVAIRLASMGLPVIINYQSNDQAAEEVRQTIIGNGGSAELMKFNVTSKEEVENAVNAWENAHPDDYIAYLVNNAGIGRDNVMFMMTDEEWNSVIDVSVNGFFYITRQLLPKMMMRKHGGRIVNMASLSGLKGLPGQTNYSASKAGIIGATKALAVELAGRGITCNAIAPGVIETEMTKAINPEVYDIIMKTIPMGRAGKPEEIASAAVFLLSEGAAYITRQCITIDGGM